MHKTLTPLTVISQDQWGLVTRRQAINAGIAERTIERLVSSGTLVERVAHGVYRIVGAPIPDHMDLRVAWLQLAPEKLAWERTAVDGVVSHRSAAELSSLGHLPAEIHSFSVSSRKQSRRADVGLHTRPIGPNDWTIIGGVPVTTAQRTVSDLLWANEDLGAVAHVVADASRGNLATVQGLAAALGPHAARFGLRNGDGGALLGWLFDLVPRSTTEELDLSQLAGMQ